MNERRERYLPNDSWWVVVGGGQQKNVHFAGVFGTAVEWPNAYLDVNEIFNNVMNETKQNLGSFRWWTKSL